MDLLEKQHSTSIMYMQKESYFVISRMVARIIYSKSLFI